MSLSQDIEDKLSDLVDDRSFQKIDESFKCFNIFEAVGAVRAELRHSNFLAFLLSPSRPHGLGAEILARLLKAFIAKIPHARRPISILKLLVGDLDTAVVERERNNIDILIEISAIKLVIVIENKVGAAVADGQLGRYKQFVRSKFSGWHQLFVLLTVDGDQPDDDTYDPEYLCFSYVDLAGLLTRHLQERRNSISDDIALILRSYVDTLRRFIVEDAELKEIARQLYFRHKEAFDFILETRPQPEGALEPLQRLIGDSADFVADRPAPRLIRFAPSDWRSVEELNSCPRDKWTKTGRNLLFELRAHRSSDRINVNLVLGPGDATFREHVYSWANKDPSLFIGITRPMGQSTSTIYVHDLLTGTAAEVMEEEQKNSAVQAAWTEFTRDQLPLLKASISKAVEAWRGRPG